MFRFVQQRCNNETKLVDIFPVTSGEDHEGEQLCRPCNFTEAEKVCHMTPCFNLSSGK